MLAIDASLKDLAEVLRILAHFVPDREVWAFGSRTDGTAKPFSDLDLAILGDAPVADATLVDLRDAFRDSLLPFKVDLIDWAAVGDSFKQIIERRHIVLQKPVL